LVTETNKSGSAFPGAAANVLCVVACIRPRRFFLNLFAVLKMAMDKLKEHAQQKSVPNYLMWVFSFIVVGSQAVQFVGTGINSVASITNYEEVVEIVRSQIAEHTETGIHTISASQIEDLKQGQNEIRGDGKARLIRDKMKIICQNPHLRPQLIGDVHRLEREYLSLTGRNYPRPTCLDLGVVG